FSRDWSSDVCSSDLVPQGVKRGNNIAANLLWDTAGYVFGIDKKGNPERALKQKKAFIERLNNELGDIPVVKSVLKFLNDVTVDRSEERRVGKEWRSR